MISVVNLVFRKVLKVVGGMDGIGEGGKVMSECLIS